LIRLGAYRQGSDPQVDEAIHYFAAIDEFIHQTKEDHSDLESGYTDLANRLDMNYAAGGVVGDTEQSSEADPFEANLPNGEGIAENG